MPVLKMLRRVSYKFLQQVILNSIKPVIGVLRMVKLFEWEKKMSEMLQQTQHEELHWLFKEEVR
jgi:hypothetical protein